MSLQRRYRDDYDYGRGRSRAVGYPAGYRVGTSPRYPYDDASDEYEYYTMNPAASRRKSRIREAWEYLEDGDLGGAVGAITRKHRARSADSYLPDRRSKRHGSFYARSRSQNRFRDDGDEILRQAVKSAVVAGAVEAIRVRKEPGPWSGEKGIRVATAALGAAGIDGVIDRDPNRKTKRHVAEAVAGGLVANRIANGPRHKLRH